VSGGQQFGEAGSANRTEGESLMKRIVVSFDGTWNKPGDEAMPPEERVESNVSRFFRSVAHQGEDGVEQIKWYNQGVGTQWYDRIAGGADRLPAQRVGTDPGRKHRVSRPGLCGRPNSAVCRFRPGSRRPTPRCS
jgi:uncharacterized protein (DUF2235 family)